MRFPYEHTLLSVIAYRARRTDAFNGDGLQVGEALIGDYKNYGMTERRYRTAKQRLAKWGFSTFKTTNKGTIAKLTGTSIWNINADESDEQSDRQATDKRRTSDEQKTTNKNERMNKNERNTPPTPQGEPVGGLENDFEKFFSAYPKKVARNAAWRAWQKTAGTRPPLSDLLGAVERQSLSEQWSKESGRFVPAPNRWLDEGRWADEMPDSAGKPNFDEMRRREDEMIRRQPPLEDCIS